MDSLMVLEIHDQVISRAVLSLKALGVCPCLFQLLVTLLRLPGLRGILLQCVPLSFHGEPLCVSQSFPSPLR